jgi:hypothetical protein
MRHYFSTQLLWMAFHASARAGEIEDAHSGEPTYDVEHHAYVLSAVVSAAAFLEAAVNELFQDAYDRHGLKDDGYIAPLAPDAVEAMAALWTGSNKASSLNALEKWQLLLILKAARRSIAVLRHTRTLSS